jgi:hypothetical protein
MTTADWLQHFDNKIESALLCCLQDSQQASGISLTNANKLVLLDPLLDELSLHQLLSRVHRLGQQRPQEVLFMLPKGSMAWLLHQR